MRLIEEPAGGGSRCRQIPHMGERAPDRCHIVGSGRCYVWHWVYGLHLGMIYNPSPTEGRGTTSDS